MKAAQRQMVTEEEFLSLPESMEKIELLDGEIIVSPTPTVWHQEVLARVVVALRAWASGRLEPLMVLMSPLDIRFAPNRILQPDAGVLFSRVPWDHRGPLDRVPELCIEVFSSNRRYDRVTKRRVYAEAGVRELWTVDTKGFIERWTGPDLDTCEAVRGELRSDLLPGFVLDVRALFEEG